MIRLIRIIISGILGRMGGRLLEVCFEEKNLLVVAGIDKSSGTLAGIPIYSAFSDCAEKADVLVDFSHPDLTDPLTAYCQKTNTALVLCTTGHTKKQLTQIRKLSAEVPVFQSANMSLGVALLNDLVRRAAVVLQNDFDIEIIERHHSGKIDSPSGTALMLANAINEVAAGKYTPVYNRHERAQRRDPAEIGIHSIRGGSIVGQHEVLFAGNDEILTLTHSATSRNIFAVGAVAAVRFLSHQPPGLYNMESMLKPL